MIDVSDFPIEGHAQLPHKKSEKNMEFLFGIHHPPTEAARPDGHVECTHHCTSALRARGGI